MGWEREDLSGRCVVGRKRKRTREERATFMNEMIVKGGWVGEKTHDWKEYPYTKQKEKELQPEGYSSR